MTAAQKKPKSEEKKSQVPRKKRGPARPYRKLPQDTLATRIKKLQKRIERAQTQATEADGFLVKYLRESTFRESEQAAQPAAT